MAQKTMNAMIKEEEVEGYILKDIPIPEPEGDEVLIKVDAVAICGSDIALYKWTPIAKVKSIFWVHALGCQVSLAYHTVLKIIRLSGGLTGPHASGKDLSARKANSPNGMFHSCNLKLFNFR